MFCFAELPPYSRIVIPADVVDINAEDEVHKHPILFGDDEIN